ncbi:MAG: GNAT family N-acetyltransferase [Ktedonobacterales bacterium]|nr:GNAT family N-acetyltransferase [Ktedonobacterales bacterium]
MMSLASGLPRDLGGGLLLRQATAADVEALVQFNGTVHAEDKPFNTAVAAISREGLAGQHPTLGPSDHLIVEATPTGEIVSSIQFIPQTWSYAGIPFGIGRIEAVGTLPEYRRKGLVRHQMDVAHQWAAERGHLATFITGIPWYYAQFGYEQAVVFRTGRTIFPALVPPLPEGQTEPFHVRAATTADVPFIAARYAAATQRYLLTTVYSADLWRFDMTGRDPASLAAVTMAIIETPTGEAVGWLEHSNELFGGNLSTHNFEIIPGVSWLAVTPSVLRHLLAVGQQMAAPTGQPLRRLSLRGEAHPAFQAFPERFIAMHRANWNAYMRVPDIAAFLRHITPALEERLARSVAVGHTGALTLHWYRDGVQLTWEQGRLVGIEPWQPPRPENGDAAFPELTFLRRLFGWQTQEELEAGFNDAFSASPEVRVLLNILFPKEPSYIRSVS